jgi:2-oxoisovalerate dehydrogenase E1 component
VISAGPWTIIRKPAGNPARPPRLPPDGLSGFSWESSRDVLAGLPGGGLNIAHETVHRHVAEGRGGHTAIRWLGGDGSRREISYAELGDEVARLARAFVDLGLVAGDRVFVLLPRQPQLHMTVLAALHAGLVVSPLFAAFGPEPIRTRVVLGAGRALITTPGLLERKVLPMLGEMPSLATLIVAEGTDQAAIDGIRRAVAAIRPELRVYGLSSLRAAVEKPLPVVVTRPEDPALVHFTSGTTGTPKGAVHVHEAVLMHRLSGAWALDLGPDDVFWCTADPGWVTGMSYGVVAPLALGCTLVVDQAEFDAVRWYEILADERVTVWYTAPTAIRMLMRAGEGAAAGRSFPDLRLVGSVGEPLHPEGVRWGERVLGRPVHDNWWQTETGGIMIANTLARDIKPGSMGRPLPGIEAHVVHRRTEHGRLMGVEMVTEPDVEGELALTVGWPSMFRGYLGNEDRYRRCFVDSPVGRLYLTEDLVRRDADGDFWFVGRADDVIKSSGHLIGPFEVEAALLEHPAVAEAGVYGLPDPLLGEAVRASVSLKPGHGEADHEPLQRDILAHARRRLGPSVAPRRIDIVASLPRTRSGKIMRRLLKARALGLPEGDTSTLEADDAAPCPNQASCEAPAPEVPAVRAPVADGEFLRGRLTDMMRIRRLEERSAELYGEGHIRGFLHLAVGEEAVAAGIMPCLGPDDAVVATYREHGQALLKGVTAGAIMAEMFGRREGCSGGRGGSMHLFDAATRFYGGNAIVAGGLPLAVGLALADVHLGRQGRVTACFFGEGAMAEGAFHESANLAALWQLPVLLVCENNLYAMGTALARSQAHTARAGDLAAKAAVHGIETAVVDGMDVLAVHAAAAEAVARVRRTGRPFFLECNTYRFRPHSMFDAELYRSREEVARWKQRDPIPCLAARLELDGLLDARGLADLEATVAAEIEAAVQFAEAGTLEPVAELARHVMTESGPAAVTGSTPGDAAATRTLSYREALREAHRAALEADPRVFVVGEDIGAYGGVYAVTKGMLDDYGPTRIRDAPLSELGFVGAAIGAALGGCRPICEIMTVNFALLPLDQIVNTAATLRHMSGGQFSVPVVFRMATGAGRQLAAQHSHSFDGWFAHVPGLRVVAPATVADARGMLAAALADPDPVVMLEHVGLYNLTDELSAEHTACDLVSAAVRRSGNDVSIVAWGGCLRRALAAAETLAGEGLSAEVIDLRSLRPIDWPTVFGSVRRTRRLVVVDESWKTAGLAAEIVARVAEELPGILVAPPARVCTEEVPIPYPRHLEEAALPSAERIATAARQALQYEVSAVPPAIAAEPVPPSSIPQAPASPAPGDVVPSIPADGGHLGGPVEVRLPALGADMEEGTLLEWKVQPGQQVRRGDILAVIDTVKAALDVESWHDGTVERLLVEPGTRLAVGTPILRLVGTETAAATASQAPRSRSSPSPPPPSRPAADEPGEMADRATAMRPVIAAAMSRSNREIPHYYLSDLVTVDAAQGWLDQANANRTVAERLLMPALFVAATARALRRFGEFNGFYRADGFEPARGIHVGVAITLRGGGLVSPALHHADRPGVDELSRRLLDLTRRARAGSLTRAELAEGTVTITNLGERGVDSVLGVIHPPQVALVGFGRPRVRPVVRDRQVVALPTVMLSLAADHRVSDGHRGGLLLEAIAGLLAEPARLALPLEVPT